MACRRQMSSTLAPLGVALEPVARSRLAVLLQHADHLLVAETLVLHRVFLLVDLRAEDSSSQWPGYRGKGQAHCRRKFYGIAEAGHARAARQPPEARCASRQARTKPIVDALHPWLKTQLARLSGKSRLAAAIRYTLKLWKGLILFLEDGRLEPDTNPVERAIRPIALNRRNALFADSRRRALGHHRPHSSAPSASMT